MSLYIQTGYETSDERPIVWGRGGTLPSRASLRGSTVFLKHIRVNKLVATKEVLHDFKQVLTYIVTYVRSLCDFEWRG